MTLYSMTGYGSDQFVLAEYQGQWELKSVNGKALDLRFRLPSGCEKLEISLREKSAKYLKRGSIFINLILQSNAQSAGFAVNQEVLSQLIKEATQAQDYANSIGATQAQINIDALMNMRGVMEFQDSSGVILSDELKEGIFESFDRALQDIVQSRATEGAHLHETLLSQVNQIETLAKVALEASETRMVDLQEKMRIRMKMVLESAEYAELGIDEDRLLQEFALIAVKMDVTEELDRLTAHIAAAKDLLTTPPPVGKKFDFLMQEFNREVNTLCSKSQDKELTKIGLEMKVLVDQMREQVQNVE